MFIQYKTLAEAIKHRDEYIKRSSDDYERGHYGLSREQATELAERDYETKLQVLRGCTGVKHAKLKENSNKPFNQTINLEKAKERKVKLSSMTYVDCDGRVFESAEAFCKHYRIRIGQFRYLREQRGLSVDRISELVNEGKIQHAN